jgi:uncharacterized protein
MLPRQLLFGQPRYVASTPWRARWAIAATIAIFFAAQLVAAAATGSAAVWIVESPQSALLLWLIVSQAAMVLMVVAAAGLGGRRQQVLQLHPVQQAPWLIGFAFVAMLVILGLLNALLYGLGHDAMADLRPHLELIRSDTWLLAALAIGVGAPLMEELTFRGFLQSALAQRVGFWPAALITTAAWTLLHWGYSVAGMAEVFLIGLYFSWLLWRSGSLWPALICHALYNSGLVLLLRFAPLPV